MGRIAGSAAEVAVKIRTLVRVDYRTADPYEGVAAVEDRLLDQTFVVVLEHGEFRGILAADDILRAPRALVADCLRAKPRVAIDTEIGEVLERMREARVTTLPVFDGERFAGVCVRSDIAQGLEAHRRELAEEVQACTVELADEVERRRQVEQDLRRSEARYRQIVETAQEGIWVLDNVGRTTFVNRRVTEMLGHPVDTMLARPFVEFLADPVADLAELPQRADIRLRRPDATAIWCLVSHVALRSDHGADGTLLMLTDVTEFKRLQGQAHHAQKMEALGTMAGGIAHDFNNILTPIMGHAEMVLQSLAGDSPLRDHIERVLQGALRARGLVAQIQSLGRRKPQTSARVAVDAVVREVTSLLRSTIPTTIEIRECIAPNAGLVLADPTELHQVILNLCTNAHHAMRERGGVLEIAVEQCTVEAATPGGPPPGDWVRIAVRDTGCGIPAEALPHLFEPYFTTKATGEGSGLGLAVVHGIVGSLGGTVLVSSELGRGTTVDVLLPRLSERMPEQRVVLPRVQGGTERILFVDDEPAIVAVGESLLSALGYRVRCCSDSLAALHIARADPAAFDLVITDEIMPRMTGSELAAVLAEVRVDLPVMIMTGNSDLLGNRSVTPTVRLAKPFQLDSLARAVRSALACNAR